MEHNLKSLSGFAIGATDGEIGKVEALYFDDTSWQVRYLVVNTGGWLSGRKVLISPAALGQADIANQVIPSRLSQEQVELSPDIDTEKTVSRQQEMALHSHYAWPFYGAAGEGLYGGMGMTGMIESRVPLEDVIAEKHQMDEAAESHLRSTDEILGYQIHATDGLIGEVKDFIFDDSDWTIRYLIVDTGNWFSEKKVVLSPAWISEISWEKSAVNVHISVDQVKHCPAYDADQPVPLDYRRKLDEHYGK